MASRCHKHTVTQGDYFEGNVACIIVLFCIPQNQSGSREILKLPRKPQQK